MPMIAKLLVGLLSIGLLWLSYGLLEMFGIWLFEKNMRDVRKMLKGDSDAPSN